MTTCVFCWYAFFWFGCCSRSCMPSRVCHLMVVFGRDSRCLFDADTYRLPPLALTRAAPRVFHTCATRRAAVRAAMRLPVTLQRHCVTVAVRLYPGSGVPLPCTYIVIVDSMTRRKYAKMKKRKLRTHAMPHTYARTRRNARVKAAAACGSIFCSYYLRSLSYALYRSYSLLLYQLVLPFSQFYYRYARLLFSGSRAKRKAEKRNVAFACRARKESSID